MNPRRRRAIARAVLAGIPKSKLNSNNIRKFLQREKAKGRLDLTEESIQDILFPNGMVNRPLDTLNAAEPETVEEEHETDEVEPEVVTVEDTNNAEDTTEEAKATYTLENTKSELQARADELGLDYKKSLSKSKLLELINNN